jgi:hypothetical protein
MSRHEDRVYLAPGASSAGALRAPGASEPRNFPDTAPRNPDAHLVVPESRAEIVHGQRVEASPARPGHGDTHTRLDAVIAASTAPGYVASTDLLTRRSHHSDFATDTCVRRAGRNPATGHRYLEEISFEIVFTQSMGEARERARDVVRHGVRRMFGLFVTEAYPDSDTDGQIYIQVREWSIERDAWIDLDTDGQITDPCLCIPLPIKALINAAEADNAVVRGLEARGTPALEQIKTRGFRSGEIEATRANLVELLAQRGIELTPEQRTRIAGCADVVILQRWFTRAITVAPDSAASLLAD